MDDARRGIGRALLFQEGSPIVARTRAPEQAFAVVVVAHDSTIRARVHASSVADAPVPLVGALLSRTSLLRRRTGPEGLLALVAIAAFSLVADESALAEVSVDRLDWLAIHLA